ncbi:hypothetical protein MAUB1S_01794 [Mycolicibacterium aubagnense]
MAISDSSSNAIVQNTSGTVPALSIAAGTSAVGAGAPLDGGAVRTTAVMQVTAAGTPTAGAVQMMGSLDGAGWFNLGSAQSITAAGTTVTVVTNTATRYVRASVTTAITGGSVSATVGLAG